MLKEILTIRQNEGEPFRRLFSDRSTFSLYVWFSSPDHICMFQLCYDQDRKEKVLTWKENRGFTHSMVDSGESHPLEYKKAPALTGGGRFEKERVLKELAAKTEEIDAAVRVFLLEKLAEFEAETATLAAKPGSGI